MISLRRPQEEPRVLLTSPTHPSQSLESSRQHKAVRERPRMRALRVDRSVGWRLHKAVTVMVSSPASQYLMALPGLDRIGKATTK